MRNFKRIVALASVFTLATATNIFAATGAKPTPEVSFGEVALGIGVGLFVAYGMKAFRNEKILKDQRCMTMELRCHLCRLRKRRKRRRKNKCFSKGDCFEW